MCSCRPWRCCRRATWGAALGVVLASLILLSSLFHFSDTESKSDDHCFVGFPAIWNIVAFYVFAFSMPIWAAALLVLACVVLTFVPLRWAHPLRTPLLWPVTLALTGLWIVGRISSRSGRVFPPARPRKALCCWWPPTASDLRCCAAEAAISPPDWTRQALRCPEPKRPVARYAETHARPCASHRAIGGTRCRLTVPGARPSTLRSSATAEPPR